MPITKSTQDWRVPKVYGASLRRWYDQETVLEFSELPYTRREMIELLGCGNFIAAKRLTVACKQFDILTLPDLDRVGLHGLLRIAGVGERAAWVAACLLHNGRYDVMAWIDRDSEEVSRSVKGGIAKAQARVRKQKRR